MVKQCLLFSQKKIDEYYLFLFGLDYPTSERKKCFVYTRGCFSHHLHRHLAFRLASLFFEYDTLFCVRFCSDGFLSTPSDIPQWFARASRECLNVVLEGWIFLSAIKVRIRRVRASILSSSSESPLE
mmetsp:Transcript_5869/g.14417  ORF Transcript_5869/g.14417 Transcript_5869/m.14417 type:complete len:127 (+) Transcript_5869:973-1353(+)